MPVAPRATSAMAVATILVALTAGCAGQEPPPAGPNTAAATEATPSIQASAPASAPAAVPDSLRFTAVTIDGKAFDAAALAGKPVVLWFWAAWCPKCRAKAGDVAAVARDRAGEIHVVGVAGLGSGDAAMGRFATDAGITSFPNLADDQGAVWKKFGVTTQEYFVIIDADGKVLHKGPLTGGDLRQRVATLAG